MATSRRSYIVSEQIDLTIVSLSEMKHLKSPELDRSIARMVALVRSRSAADSLQEQRETG